MLRLAPKDDGSDAVFEFEASAGIAAALGPVQASLDRIGLLLTADFTKQDKNLGFVDLSFDFKPPSGVGLAINAAGVTGGGFLEHDGADGRYAGAIQLAFADLDLSAYGLIATKLPSGAPGFSAVVVISTEFSPGIELPFGFTLDGVGGILGLNRTLALDTVEAALWAHRLDNLLFPANPIAAAPALLTSLDSRRRLRPLAKIGWGSIADAVIGLMIELPEPLRLLLLGEIAVLVPREHPQLELHIDFAGGYDMGKQQAFFDASLHNSRIERYPIVGDLAFRYDWGSPGSQVGHRRIQSAFSAAGQLSVAEAGWNSDRTEQRPTSCAGIFRADLEYAAVRCEPRAHGRLWRFQRPRFSRLRCALPAFAARLLLRSHRRSRFARG